jgi:hypothetical protein
MTSEADNPCLITIMMSLRDVHHFSPVSPSEKKSPVKTPYRRECIVPSLSLSSCVRVTPTIPQSIISLPSALSIQTGASVGRSTH